jgi:hypothetical protein
MLIYLRIICHFKKTWGCLTFFFAYIYNCNNIRECPFNADINLLCHGPVINDPIERNGDLLGHYIGGKKPQRSQEKC